MMPTLRRLNDRERYYGLTFPGWIAVALAGGVLYAAVQVSPFGTRATVTIVVLVLAFAAMVAPALRARRSPPAATCRDRPLPPRAQAARAAERPGQAGTRARLSAPQPTTSSSSPRLDGVRA